MIHRKGHVPALTLAAAVTLLLLSACSSGDDSKPTITGQQAAARVAQLLQGTGAAITPRPRLELYKQGTYTGACAEEPDGNSDARVQATSRYFLQDVPEQDRASIGEQILHLWKDKGYTIENTYHMGTSSPEIHGATPDGFLIALEQNGGSQFSIVASSPCVWPNGTPPPGS